MKRVLKLLFVFALLMVNVQIAAAGDFGTTAIAMIGSVALLNLVIPFSRYTLDSFNAITEVKIFHSYIIEKIYQSVAFLTKSRDASDKVLGGAVVYIPQAGYAPTIIKNNNAWPLTAVQRTDSDVNYSLDAYSTTPSHVAWQELQAISYDKLDSVIGSHIDELIDVVAKDMLIKWAPTVSGKQIATTGSNIGAVGAQTGTRKALASADIVKLMNAFNIDGIPQDNRQLLIDENMFEAFYSSLSDTQMNAFNQFADNKTGQLGKLHSFNIFTRQGIAYASGGNSPKALGSSVSGTDNLACLAWHPNFVERAIGDTKLFSDKDNPLYQGDLFSAIVRAGGRKVREDNKGVYTIVQAAGA